VYGWIFFAVIQTGTIAAVGVAFSKFAAYLFHPFSETNFLLKISTGINDKGIETFFTISVAQAVAIILIAFLTWTNTKGVKGGKWIQNIFTSTKLLSLFGLIIAGIIFFKPGVWNANWTNAFTMKKLSGSGGIEGVIGAGILGAIAASMVGSIFSSDAWNNVTFIAGEIQNPKRNIGLSLFLGTFIVTLIYVCANLVYIAVLPLHDLAFAPQDRVAVAAANSMFGNAGTYVIAIMIMISTFGCNNGLILAGARVYYSMGKDGLFFIKASTLNKHAITSWELW
jgi:APA family basic amino acid/polyamine antiporter